MNYCEGTDLRLLNSDRGQFSAPKDFMGGQFSSHKDLMGGHLSAPFNKRGQFSGGRLSGYHEKQFKMVHFVERFAAIKQY
ncbi:hypothetical protein DPMN_134432 [Dreissena polymorpha]|uniref:Uncharacterized protein n=1 Tax=Dreissena polymorpha TaxID=45954 RepID=A0A9D4JEW2_DREPO|nr:hypothetical protein DPMN_134432 [Dreissena polymorpha]